MKKILILNGPNLGALGQREPHLYGTLTLQEIIRTVRETFPELDVVDFQSNHEGALIDTLLDASAQGVQGVVLNAGAYTHTSLAMADAVRACGLPVVEVHLSNVYAREAIRHTSLIAPACVGVITGFGHYSYILAVKALAHGE